MAATLYEQLIKAGDEKTLWTTVAERDPHPGWIKRRDEVIAQEKKIRDEWDMAQKEKDKWLEILNNARFENGKNKAEYASWIKEMTEKGEEIYKKEQMRIKTKKED